MGKVISIFQHSRYAAMWELKPMHYHDEDGTPHHLDSGDLDLIPRRCCKWLRFSAADFFFLSLGIFIVSVAISVFHILVS